MKKETSLTLEKFDCEASRSSLERLDLRDETLNSSLKQDASASDVTCVLGLPSKAKHKQIERKVIISLLRLSWDLMHCFAWVTITIFANCSGIELTLKAKAKTNQSQASQQNGCCMFKSCLFVCVCVFVSFCFFAYIVTRDGRVTKQQLKAQMSSLKTMPSETMITMCWVMKRTISTAVARIMRFPP